MERAQEAMATIGLAVLNGGITTFLALVLLGASSSHVFISFFKVSLPCQCANLSQVFVLTVVFGLFHGLVLFPALLAMLGPEKTSSSSSPAPPEISVLGENSSGRDNNTFEPDMVRKTIQNNLI